MQALSQLSYRPTARQDFTRFGCTPVPKGAIPSHDTMPCHRISTAIAKMEQHLQQVGIIHLAITVEVLHQP
jgi:hypothetical protein